MEQDNVDDVRVKKEFEEMKKEFEELVEAIFQIRDSEIREMRILQVRKMIAALKKKILADAPLSKTTPLGVNHSLKPVCSTQKKTHETKHM